MSVAHLLRIIVARYKMVLAIFSLVVLTTAVASILTPKSYTAKAILIMDFAGMDPITGAVINAQQLLPTYMSTQADVIASHKVALRVVDVTKMMDDAKAKMAFAKAAKGNESFEDWLADDLLGGLEVSPSRQSNMIEVSYSADSPDLAAKLANAFTQAYIETNLELRTDPARQSAIWFEDQLRGLRDDLANSQARLSAAQKEKGIVSIGQERLDMEKSRLGEFGSQLVLAQSEASEAISHQKHLEEARAQGKSFEDLPEVLASPLVQNLKAYLNATEGKLAEISERVGTNHPSFQRTQAEVANLKRKLKSEIDHVVNGINAEAQIAQRREAELRAALASEKAKVLDLANQRDEVSVLIREVENAQRAYDAALKRFSETQMESEVSQTNISVLNAARSPLKHSRPKVKMNIALAILFGGVLAVGAALAAEMMAPMVRGIEDLELALDLPVLGVIKSPPRTALPTRETTKSLPWLTADSS